MIYEIVENFIQTLIKKQNEDGSITYIPIDESNSDYKEYLAWKVENDKMAGGE